MAQQTLNSNSTQPLGGPNQGLGTDQGDTWDVTVTKLTTMFNDLYGTAGGIPAAITNGSNAFTVVAGTTGVLIPAQGVIQLSTLGDFALGAPVKGSWCEVIFTSTQGSTASGTNQNVNFASTIGGSSINLNITVDGLNTVARNTAATQKNAALSLVGLSTIRWAVVSNVGLGGTNALTTGA